MVLKEASLPEDIIKLGTEGVNQLWRRAKLRGAGMKRAKALVTAYKGKRVEIEWDFRSEKDFHRMGTVA